MWRNDGPTAQPTPACGVPRGAGHVPALMLRQVLLNELEMQPASASAMLESAGLSLVAVAGQVSALLAEGYQRAPALVVILSAMLVLPVAAIASLIVHATARRRSRRAAIRAAELKAQAAEWTSEDTLAPISIPVAHQAWLTIEGADSRPLAGQLIRIGRHQDNDVRLEDASVHRYHAVIEHTAGEAFVITDLSGNDGNGVRINGERLAQAQLIDGDIIELGRTRLKFENVPV